MNIRRRRLIALGSAVLLLPCVVAAQPTRVYRVGWLGQGSLATNAEFIDGVKKVLRVRGYIEGKNLAFEYRWAEGKSERFPSAAAELVALKPDVIVSGSTPGTSAIKRATATIPTIMFGVADPVGAGFAASLARPGGNITGQSNMARDMGAKNLELLHGLVPQAKRISVLMSDNPSHPVLLNEIRAAATALGLTILPVVARSTSDFDRVFSEMRTAKSKALIVIADALFILNQKEIAERANQSRLPAIYSYSNQVKAGGLISYGPNPRNIDEIVAGYIDKILQGAKPGDLPIQQPTEFELAINLKTAKALGITIPQDILLRANEVIE